MMSISEDVGGLRRVKGKLEDYRMLRFLDKDDNVIDPAIDAALLLKGCSLRTVMYLQRAYLVTDLIRILCNNKKMEDLGPIYIQGMFLQQVNDIGYE